MRLLLELMCNMTTERRVLNGQEDDMAVSLAFLILDKFSKSFYYRSWAFSAIVKNIEKP
jgi:hypothetical protein